MEQAQNTANSNVIDKIPPIVHEIIDVLGMRDAEKFIEMCGGLSIKIPTESFHNNPRIEKIMDCIGYEAMEKLMFYFGGETVYIPRNHQALKQLRNERYLSDFVKLVNNGLSMNMAYISLHPVYGKSDRWAQRLVAANRHRLNLPRRAAKQSKVKQVALA